MKYAIILFAMAMLVACSSKSNKALSNKSGSKQYTEQHRPQFHFSPAAQWMNDPNGMVYYEGEYHLFFQHYPDSNVWGPMHWGHAVSPDLVRWEELPIALYPDDLGYIFSGSAVIDWKNTSGFGTDDSPPMVAIFTHHDPVGEKDPGNDRFQYQSLAYSTDNGRSWTKYAGNPVIANPGIRDFRDPKVFWDEYSKQWVMVFAAYDHIKVYGSSDLKGWYHLSDFGAGLGAHGGVWECPDLFPLVDEESGEKKWVLLVSINPGGPNGGSATQYFIGDFDGRKFIPDSQYDSEEATWLDHGRDNYAGVTWSDIPESDGRRLFIGWMSNWDYAQVVPTYQWRSAMTLPRELKLHSTDNGYRLTSHPVEELQTLRKISLDMVEQDVEGEFDLSFIAKSKTLQMESFIEFNREQALVFRLTNKKGESCSIGYNPGRECVLYRSHELR